MKKIPTWEERCEKHPDHNGIVTTNMIQDRMQEEIDELRSYLQEGERAIKLLNKISKIGITANVHKIIKEWQK